ncbi:hypothetical protein LCGC14_1848950 [marine sediment metagenome]|uniref:Uncharacterized protein n=1 Tax=marine sediment metagenome TaxID=412755 RepID=A0A0F9IQJ1_9ZZZZ
MPNLQELLDWFDAERARMTAMLEPDKVIAQILDLKLASLKGHTQGYSDGYVEGYIAAFRDAVEKGLEGAMRDVLDKNSITVRRPVEERKVKDDGG